MNEARRVSAPDIKRFKLILQKLIKDNRKSESTQSKFFCYAVNNACHIHPKLISLDAINLCN